MIQRIKGTQDQLDLTLLNFIYESTADHLILHNFNQIELPILESTELFQRTVGTETDIVQKEMFTIAPRTGSNESICLRPEATASATRAFLENNIIETPWKVFCFGPMFRYERPQKGRFREFRQCSIEVVDANSIDHDVLLINNLCQLFREKWQIHNYGLLLNFLGCPQDRISFKNQLVLFLKQHLNTVCATCQTRINTNPLRVLDCKNDTCQELYLQAPQISTSYCLECNQEWQQLQKHLLILGIAFAIQPNLVRGLDYYNKTVFEFVSTDLGAQSTFCGGGRYELASQLGSKQPVPSVGAAFGVERILLILESRKNQLPIAKKAALSVVIPLTNQQNTLALLIAQSLFKNQFCTEVLLEDNSVKSKMRKANKLGATYCILIGEQEQIDQTVTVKLMLNGQEEIIKQTELIDFLKK